MDTVTHTVQVDSRDRDPNESANNYVMYMTEPVKQIKDVIIRDIQVPNSTYNVVDGKNTFETNALTTPLVTIAPGSYSGLDLATQIFNITTSTAIDPTWNVVYETGSKKFIFTQVAAFTLTFNMVSEDLADTLGFDITPATLLRTSATGTPTYYGNDITLQTNFIPSDRIANLVKDKYFYLEIEELSDPRVQTAKRNDFTTFDTRFAGNNLSRIFGKVPVYAGPGNDVFFDRNSTFKLVRSYMSPLSSLSRLSIKWLDYEGNLIPFNGLPQNSFTLELVCENREKGW